jgi:mannose-6-phosphate isomerase
VQVHPDDELARTIHGPHAIGKHEAWVVLEAAPGAEILLGRDPGVSAAAITQALTSGADVTPLLARHAVQRGDVFDVPTGCLHAMMPGLFVWEVQQRSDRTYRVADWGRNDPSRPLHHAEALRATDATYQATRTTAIDWGKPGEQHLITSPHFSARAVIGPWAGEILVGGHGATTTAIGTAMVGGLQLSDLGTAHLATGLQSIDLAAGSALLIAEGN